MNTQSIRDNSRIRILKRADKKFIEWGNDYLLKTRYGVGSFESVFKMKAISVLDNILHRENGFIGEPLEKVNERLSLLI